MKLTNIYLLGAKRPADPVGWRRAGNEQKTVLPKAKKSSENAVAHQSEGQAFNNKPSCTAGSHTQYERRKARLLLLLIALVSMAPANAKKKIKIIKCPQADGTIVLQDFACMQTTTPKAKSTKPKVIKKQKKVIPKLKPRAKLNTQLPQPLRKTPKKPINSKKSIRQIPQWHDLIKRLNPNNLQQKKVFQNNTVNIMVATVTPAQKITLTHYPDSSKILGKKAFSAAISIFRQVTQDQTQQVTESEFIPNSNYKVFNLYHQKQNQRHFKQFYINEYHDSLYVLELTAPTENWRAAQQTIAQITAQLKL